MSQITISRRHDLDWLRVLAILLLLYFHTAMIFASDLGWHIKNEETSQLLREANYFLSRWRMPLLFLISGIGTSFALRRRTAREYVAERTRRLLVPVVFGILVVVPPQIYIERIANGAEFGSFLSFFPTVFTTGPYPHGNLSWHHLWFVVYLFLYSLAALPLFLHLRRDGGRIARAVERRLSGLGLYALALPLGAVLAGLAVRWRGPQNIVDDWAFLLYYFLFFVYGYLFATAEASWTAIERRRQSSLALAIGATTATFTIRWSGAAPPLEYSVEQVLFHLLQGLNAWAWVLAILGYGKRYLDRPSRLLQRANEGIYPFYIVHQTVIILVGYPVIQTGDGIVAKYLVVSTVSLILSWATVELLIRPFALTRFLFGMRPMRTPVHAGNPLHEEGRGANLERNARPSPTRR